MSNDGIYHGYYCHEVHRTKTAAKNILCIAKGCNYNFMSKYEQINDLSDLLGLLTILAKQLELSMDDSSADFEKICDLCSLLLQNNDNQDVNIVLNTKKTKHQLVIALQFHDRMSQRVSHVSKSLNMIANHLRDIDLHLVNNKDGVLKLDFDNEIKKTLSFFNTSQTAEMCKMISKDSSWLLDHNVKKQPTNKFLAKQEENNTDTEFF